MSSNIPVITSLDAFAVGRTSSTSFITHFDIRDPTTGDVNYPVQQRWYNTVKEAEWILTGYSVNAEVKTAIWLPISASVISVTETLTGNTGGAVGVDGANNINVLGDTTTINIAGNPGTHTLTVSTAGSVATLYTEDTGTATPSGGNLNVLGTNGLHTSGTGSTITIGSTNGQLLTGLIPDAHTAPGTAPVVPNSSGNITVTGGQVAAGTTTNVIRTDSLAANTYTVEVQRSQAVASSTIGDNGVCHFDNTQFSVDANGFVHFTGVTGLEVVIQAFTTTGIYTPTPGMITCVAEMLGGGGAGGGAAATGAGEYSSGGGGAGGEYARGFFSAATIGASKAVTIGAGGVGVTGTTGATGGTTSLGVLMTALGGNGGNTTTASSTPGSTIGAGGGSGGTGGVFRNQGGSGQIGFTSPAGDFAIGGAGGQSIYGAGSAGQLTTASGTFAGGLAAFYGCGGGGGTNGNSKTATAGGNGTAGVIIITEYLGGSGGGGTTLYTEDSGTAAPAGGNLNIFGGTGIITSGAGLTVTISAKAPAVSVVKNQVFTTSGTYTPTANMVYCSIQTLGGGGGGGGSVVNAGGNVSVGAGGGAGEYAVGVFSAATIGASKSVTIGALGAGGIGVTGTAGGNTSVGALISAFGGSGGQSSGSSPNEACSPGAGGTGGSGGDYRTPGMTSNLRSFANLATGLVEAGGGANSQLGSGGLPTGSPSDGFAASGFGAGGGGAGGGPVSGPQTGGDGSPGVVIVTEYIS